MLPLKAVSSDLYGLVDRLRRGEAGAFERLGRFLSAGPRLVAEREVGPAKAEKWCLDLEPKVVDSILSGEIADLNGLLAFVQRSIATLRAGAAAHVRDSHGKAESLDDRVELRNRRRTLIKALLVELSDRDREILRRFYLRGQSIEQICSEMAISEAEFLSVKIAAKTSFRKIAGFGQ